MTASDVVAGQGAIRFDGATVDAARDGERLHAMLERVLGVMSDGRWYSPEELLAELGIDRPGCAVTSRIRDLRKPKFGAHVVESRARAGTKGCVWEYRLVLRTETAQ